MFNILFPLIIFICALIPRIYSSLKTDMTWDEGLYTLAGLMGFRNILNKDFSEKSWNFEFHPPLMMLVTALPLGIYVFITNLIKFNLKNILNKDFITNEIMKNYKGTKGLILTRSPSIIFGSITAVLVYLILFYISNNYIIAVSAGLIFALSPFAIAWSSLAMLESGLTFLYTFLIWNLMLALDTNFMIYWLISGLLLGLIVGTKETGFTAIPFSIILLLSHLLLNFDSINILSFLFNGVVMYLTGVLIFFLSWPFLWKKPVTNLLKALKDTTSMKSEENPSTFHYINCILSSTPIIISLLFIVGLFVILVISPIFVGMSKTLSDYLILLLWTAIPIIIMTMPFVPKRGAHQISFIMAPIAAISGFGYLFISFSIYELLSLSLNFNVYNGFLLTILVLLLSLILFKSKPFYFNYSNYLSKLSIKNQNLIPFGFWGEGLSHAIEYIDIHAPKNSSVLIYAPKSSAIYHSNRLNFKKTNDAMSLFSERKKQGHDVSVDENLYQWKNGDLVFYFPYYDKLPDIKQINPSYIIIYKWITYDQSLTHIDDTNHNFVSEVKKNCKPIYIVNLHGKDLCWIYQYPLIGK